MSLQKAKELREKRAGLILQMQDISKRADQSGNLSQVDQEQWIKLDAEVENLRSQYERLEKEARYQAELDARQLERTGDQKEEKSDEEKAKERRKQWENIIRATESRGLPSASEWNAGREQRGTSTQITTTTTLGGYLVPEDFSNEIERYMVMYGGMMDACRVVTTGSGADMPWPTVNDTSNTGALITEGTGDTVSDVTFGSVTMKMYTYTSKVIKVSWELMQDSFFGLENEVSMIAGERLGRITNTHFTTGDNSSKPQGIITAASSGKTAASATAFTRSELVDLMHSIDPAYRKSASCAWMFNDTTLAAIKKLTFGSGDDRPLWQPGIAVGEPDRLEGKPFYINQDMASPATGTKPILFGDFSKYLIRVAKDTELVILRERYADERVVGFFAYKRCDGRAINTSAYKYLTMA